MSRSLTSQRVGGLSIGWGEAAGAVADLGVFVPLAAALILVNGLSAGAGLLGAGLLYMGAGLWFRVPFPVQPFKAVAAIAVAHQLPPSVIHAAGLEMAGLLLLIGLCGLANRVAQLFTRPVIRALQLGVGLMLLAGAWKLAVHPPAGFAGVPTPAWRLLLTLAALMGVALAARTAHYGAALAILAVGVAATAAAVGPDLSAPALSLPSLHWPATQDFAVALGLLVIPQFPLTFGNAVVAVDDLAHEYFGPAARRVSPGRICISDALGNLVAGLLGGMPMCHGAGGLTAHVRLGARTAGMNLLLGGTLIAAGLFWAGDIPVLLGLLPVWALAALLAYAALRHALLVGDLRGWPLAVAGISGAVGAAAGNLAITLVLALLLAHLPRLITARRASDEPASAAAAPPAR